MTAQVSEQTSFKVFEFPQHVVNKDIISMFPKKEKVWESNPESIKNAYGKILENWNKNEKSRNFIKHLIAAFLPYDNFMRMIFIPIENKIKCAILNVEITGIQNIAEEFTKFSMSKMFIDSKVMTENRTEYTEEEIKKIEKEKNQMRECVKESRVAIHSDKSDKYLLVESNLALYVFTQEMLWLNNKEFDFLIKKMRIKSFNDNLPKEKQLSKKEVNVVSKATTFGVKSHMKDSAFSALEKLKATLEESEKSKSK